MCSRYTFIPSKIRNTPLPRSIRLPDNYLSRFNISPQQLAPVARATWDGTVCEEMRWGFQPSWMTEAHRAQINVRAQSIFWSLMFRDSTLNRRCIVLASGWYEWPDNDQREQPYYYHRRGDGLLGIAGIWTPTEGNTWTEGQRSFAIITTDANPSTTLVTNRTPVVLPEYEYDAWLDPHNHDVGRLERALASYTPADFDRYRVGYYVNDPSFDSEKCIEPAPEPQEGGEGLGAERNI